MEGTSIRSARRQRTWWWPWKQSYKRLGIGSGDEWSLDGISDLLMFLGWYTRCISIVVIGFVVRNTCKQGSFPAFPWLLEICGSAKEDLPTIIKRNEPSSSKIYFNQPPKNPKRRSLHPQDTKNLTHKTPRTSPKKQILGQKPI